MRPAEAVSGGGWSGRWAARNGGIARPCGLGYFSAMPSAESSSLPSAATPSLTPDSVAAHCESQLRLLLELEDGTRKALSAGEVSVRGMYGYV